MSEYPAQKRMSLPPRAAILILIGMIAAPTLAGILRPTEMIANDGPKIDLETMFPRRFGGWQLDEHNFTPAIDPQQSSLIKRLYDQTLSRVYINPDGYRVMLSVAYGGNQSDAMQVHRPEVCYPAQGFAVSTILPGTLATRVGTIPVVRLTTAQGQRREPVTYWVTVGDTAVTGGIQKKLVEIKYGLTGKVPDGMLVRVSSIDPDEQRSFHMQEDFVNEILESMRPQDQARIAGLHTR